MSHLSNDAYPLCILVYGHRGWIGSMACQIMDQKNLKYVCGSARLESVDQVRKDIETHHPTHIMSFTGRTHGTAADGRRITTIDYLEEEGKLLENLQDNLYGPLVLAFLAREYKLHFTYLGTGCIFEYDDSHPMGSKITGFKEDDHPNFFGSSYSVAKGITDQLMHFFKENTLNLRIRMPIVDEMNERNFITKITTYAKICSLPNSMSVLDDLLPLAIELACEDKVGTLNFTNPGVITHNEILTLYKEIVDPSFTWENFTVEEQDTILASKRSNNHLCTDRLESICPNLKPIAESVRDTLHRMKAKLDSK